MKLLNIVKHLEKFAPLSLAESWDNVGLLLEPSISQDITKVLTTVDLTETVLEEAIERDCKLLLSYHPPIFNAFKRLTQASANERIVIKCLENNIAVYSPHTSWDSVDNGVNDWIVRCFDYKSKFPITPNTDIVGAGMGRIISLMSPLPLTTICALLRTHLSVKHLRLGHADTAQWAKRHQVTGQSYDLIQTVAVCAGSGGSLLNGIEADLYITGEMSHHEVLAVVAEGRNVLLSEHTHTERGYLEHVVVKLSKQVGEGVEFLVSQHDKDPLDYI